MKLSKHLQNQVKEDKEGIEKSKTILEAMRGILIECSMCGVPYVDLRTSCRYCEGKKERIEND